jgi:glycolate oxidase FAD binding subunit
VSEGEPSVPSWIERVVTPTSIPELAEAVRAHNRGAIYPIGAGSWMDLGYSPMVPGLGVSTRLLNRVVDYPHEELTITVEAGILVTELQKILAEKGQMLPFDCPHPEKATLGGLLATNTSGPRRLAYGTARDSILGLDVIDADGQRIHGGGRVVKNVAGYDLPKMHIGALGTLGIIVEATIKVRPMPEASAVVRFSVDSDDLPSFLRDVSRSKLRPVAVEVDNVESAWASSLAFEDSAEAVAFQVGLCERFRALDSTTNGEPAFRTIQNLANRLADASGNMGAKTSMRPTETWELLGEYSKAFPSRAIRAHALSGIMWVCWNTPSVHQARLDLDMLRAFRGFSIVRQPPNWSRDLPIWGDLGPEIEWMRRLRNALDPQRRLNPGRFVVE